jgi:hypothetical protein
MSHRYDRSLDSKIGSAQIARALQELVGDRATEVLPIRAFSAIGIRPANYREICCHKTALPSSRSHSDWDERVLGTGRWCLVIIQRQRPEA